MSKELYRKSVGRRIRFIRLNRGETMEEFANLIHQHNESLSPGKSNVSRWERGENIPNELTLKAIADIGNTTIDELLNENPLHNYLTEELQAEINRRKKAERQLDLTK